MGDVVSFKKKRVDVSSDAQEEMDKHLNAVDQQMLKSAKQHKRLRILSKKQEIDERDVVVMLNALLSTTLAMVPIAQKNYYRFNNERAAYAYNALVSQVREISNDLRMVRDLTKQANLIIKIVQDAYLELAKEYAAQVTNVKKQTKTITSKHAKVNAALDDMIRNFGFVIENNLKGVELTVNDLMLEPEPAPRKKPKTKMPQ